MPEIGAEHPTEDLIMPRPDRFIAAAVLALSASPALAQSQLDRLEVLDERMNGVIFAALEAQIPALSGYMPSLDWDDTMRQSGTCLLQAVEAQTGTDGVEQLLANYETTVAEATAAPGDLGGIRLNPPDGMATSEFQEAYAECGMLEWLSNRLAESGALAIILESSQ
ncbi:hypothetical protein N8I71_16460 [Roseibacterium sp. SDUM158016]|uniref:hypothetical protein n=1 Tax=Roseicyclus sediminis TaxID=2980997 RepID=UPI0021D1D1AC|nr:hypothetical protein [Roseibacterium sp. SDUM158016]MCU4654434.1 hypothetical protein [Roseibacterium sp. SDUM158016]